MYPLLFMPIYKEMIWGGERMREKLGRELPFTHTGESWDISCRPKEMGVVENGLDARMSFAALIERYGSRLLGRRVSEAADFPLLIKIIDANEHLSVQVHPGDAYAHAHENGAYGKTEMWYIMEAPLDGHLVIGLRDGVTQEDLRRAYENGTVEACLNRLPVKAGDIVNIPAGLVHALTKGVMVAEVQQNSDITYRLYDYNRLGLDGKPRALHPEQSLAVTDYSGAVGKRAVPGLAVENGGNSLVYSIANSYFAIIKYEITQSLTESSDPNTFSVFTCVEGSVQVVTPSMTVYVPCGRSVLIPAELGEYTLQGHCVLLKSFVPDKETDFAAPLRRNGFTDEEIQTNTAIH